MEYFDSKKNEIVMPDAVQSIIEELESAGYEAYIVGGCVRDALLGRIPNDWDITTSASPMQVKALFARTIDTGIQHGTVTVMVGKEGYEVTTYRIDGAYSDGRHPDGVTFTSNLGEDLLRRDFTINAMAYHPKRGIVDLYHGREDLKKGIIRCVGRAKDRFLEDALRILRAVRFAAQLHFEIDGETEAAIRELAGNLQKISHERIRDEVNKLLLSAHPEYVMKLWEYKITGVIAPWFDRMMETPQQNAYHEVNVAKHTVRVIANTPPSRELRWAALLHDVGKPDTLTVDSDGTTHFYGHAELGETMAKQILRDFKWDNDTIRDVSRMVRWHDYRCPQSRKSIRKAVNQIGKDIFPAVLELMRADTYGKRRETWEKSLADIDASEAIYRDILEEGECVSLKELEIDGHVLMTELGLPSGRILGEILQTLLGEVLEDSGKNKREYLLKRAKQLYDCR